MAVSPAVKYQMRCFHTCSFFASVFFSLPYAYFQCWIVLMNRLWRMRSTHLEHAMQVGSPSFSAPSYCICAKPDDHVSLYSLISWLLSRHSLLCTLPDITVQTGNFVISCLKCFCSGNSFKSFDVLKLVTNGLCHWNVLGVETNLV